MNCTSIFGSRRDVIAHIVALAAQTNDLTRSVTLQHDNANPYRRVSNTRRTANFGTLGT
jgi:hypothetical protein